MLIKIFLHFVIGLLFVNASSPGCLEQDKGWYWSYYILEGIQYTELISCDFASIKWMVKAGDAVDTDRDLLEVRRFGKRRWKGIEAPEVGIVERTLSREKVAEPGTSIVLIRLLERLSLRSDSE